MKGDKIRKKSKMSKKKILKTFMALCLSTAVIAGVMPAALNAAPNEKEAKAVTDGSELKLWYDEPASSTPTAVGGASKWEAATLPIGNGKIGSGYIQSWTALSSG